MNQELLREKNIFHIFSKLENLRANNVHVMLTVDTLLKDNNSFKNLIQIAQEIEKLGIKCSPDKLKSILDEINYEIIFENYNPQNEINSAFRINKNYFTIIKSYGDSSNTLDQTITEYVKVKEIDKKYIHIIREIFLETIFNKNIEYLKLIVKPKGREAIDRLKIINVANKYKQDDIEYYNDFINTTTESFNKVLQNILVKTCDFLTLNYSTETDKYINQKFGNKIFYLDSSIILRILGFNNEVRESRATRLIDLLKNVKGLKFVIHRETLAESQDRINKLVAESSHLLSHSQKANKYISEKLGKTNNTVDLFLRLKEKNQIQNFNDFTLYFSNIKNLLKRKFGTDKFDVDDEKIKIDTSKIDALKENLEKTDKTNNRINHISRLLNHIENKRGANNYHIYDIQYWLITTDNKTLTIDSGLIELSNNTVKSACILPTELIRIIESVGEISGDYIDVYKKYIIYSQSYQNEFDEAEIKALDKVLTLAENAAKSNYDVEFFIDNLFDKYTLDQIVKRLKKIENEQEKNKELVQMFNESNNTYFEERLFIFIEKEEKRLKLTANILFIIFCFAIPLIVTIYLLMVLISPNAVFNDPLTWIDVANFGKLEFIIIPIEAILIPTSIYLFKKYRKTFVLWFYEYFKTK
ncbi:MAG: hypothetical protein IPN39_06270 [Chitinophagaceae bacterium]|nr:hypothetical protein [Chitinophagaceae bacterium]